jgi:uncharacterized phage protein (TIGR01671 family)
MRDIKFRGKRKDDKEWVYGDLVTMRKNRGFIHPKANKFKHEASLSKGNMVLHEVIPETVGQYVGIDDIDKNKIYEGDILKSIHTVTMLVLMEKGHCKAKYQDHNNETWKDMFEQNWVYIDDLNVIGNKFDNPELLEVKKND